MLNLSGLATQPKGFFVLFYAQLCERFGFYTSFYLLVPVAISTLGLSPVDATLLFGAYTGLAYSTAFAGGIIGDRLLGYRASIAIGLIIMACGSMMMASGSTAAVYFGLALNLVGNGYFTPNVSGLLGLQFSTKDVRREASFTLFYMSSNIGAAAAALCSGLLARQFGFPSAFLFAAVIILTSLVPLNFSRGTFKSDTLRTANGMLWRVDLLGLPNLVWLVLGTSIAAVIGHQLLYHTFLTGAVLFLVLGGVLVFFLREVLQLSGQSRRNGLAMLLLFGFGGVFWALFNENGGLVLLFVDQAVDRTVFGAEIPASAVLSLNPIFILTGAPLMAVLWFHLSSQDFSPSYGTRFVIGFLLIAGAFALLGFAPTGQENLVSVWWFLLFYLLYSLGELCVAPIALSMISQLATRELMGFSMGLWLLVQAAGNYSSGLLAGLAPIAAGAGVEAVATASQSAFIDFSLLSLCAGLLLLAVLPILSRYLRPSPST